MDNVTHTLFALTLARTPLGRGRGATIALLLASNAPDSDIVAALNGGASYLEWHRGPTHGPLGVVGLGLATAAIVWAGAKTMGRRRSSDGTVAPFATLVLVSMAGVLAHILMDLPTSYGIRLLSPFSWQWFAADLMPIIDVYLLAALAGGLLLGRGSVRAQQASAAIVLAFMAANYGLRAFAHQEALVRTERLFGPTLPRSCDATQAPRLVASWSGESTEAGTATGSRPCLRETAAIPTLLSPFRWRVIARLSDAYALYEIDIMDARLRSRTPPPDLLTAITERVPDQRDAFTEKAARTESVRTLLAFSRFPQARVLSDASGSIVRFTDMRFDVGQDERSPLQTRRQSLFTATVRIGEP